MRETRACGPPAPRAACGARGARQKTLVILAGGRCSFFTEPAGQYEDEIENEKASTRWGESCCSQKMDALFLLRAHTGRVDATLRGVRGMRGANSRQEGGCLRA